MRAASCISLFPWTLKRRKKMQRHGRQIGVINSSSILGFCSRNKAIPGGTQGCWLMMMTIALMHCGQNSSGCTLGDLPHSSSPCRGGWVCWWLEKCSFIFPFLIWTFVVFPDSCVCRLGWMDRVGGLWRRGPAASHPPLRWEPRGWGQSLPGQRHPV